MTVEPWPADKPYEQFLCSHGTVLSERYLDGRFMQYTCDHPDHKKKEA